MYSFDQRISRHRDFIMNPQRDFLLGVRINDRTPNRYPYGECFGDPRLALDMAMDFLRPSLELASDFVPTLYPIQFRMIHPIPALFGCPMELVADDARAVPIIEDIERVWDMKVPSLDHPVFLKVLEHLEYYRKFAPPGIPVTPPGEQSPFIMAYQMRGDAIFLDLYDNPEAVKRLLQLITDTFILVERQYKAILGEPAEWRVSFQNLFVPGLRIAADSNVLLAPGFIEEFEMPCLERIAAEFGPLAIHYCGTLACPGHHVAEVLSRHACVKVLNTQLEPYLDGRNTGRLNHPFKLTSIWEIADLPGFIHIHREKLSETRGVLFLVQVENREQADSLLLQWPELRAGLLESSYRHDGNKRSAV